MKRQSQTKRIKRPVVKKEFGFDISVDSIRRAENALQAELRSNEAKLAKSATIAARQYMGRSPDQ